MDSPARVLDRGALLRGVLRAMLLAAAAVAAYLTLSLLDGPARADPSPVGDLLRNVVSTTTDTLPAPRAPADSRDQGVSGSEAGVSHQKPLDHEDAAPEPKAVDRPARPELPARAPDVAEKEIKPPADVADPPTTRRSAPTKLDRPLADLADRRTNPSPEPQLPMVRGVVEALDVPEVLDVPAVSGAVEALDVPAALELPVVSRLSVPEVLDVPAVTGAVEALGVPAALELPVVRGAVEALDVPAVTGAVEALGVPAVLEPVDVAVGPALAPSDTGETTVVSAGPVTQAAAALAQPTAVTQAAPEAAPQAITEATTEATITAAAEAAAVTEPTTEAAIKQATAATEPIINPIATKQGDRRETAEDGSDQPAPRPPGEPDYAAGGSLRAGGEGGHDRPGTAGRPAWHPELVASATVIPADTELGGRSADVDPPSG